MTIGDRLRKRRLDLGLLQREVADQLGVDEGTVTNWELNRTAPALRFLPQIIGLLGSDPRPGGVTLAEQLLTCRTARGLSREAAARLLGVDPGTLWGGGGGSAVKAGPKLRSWRELRRSWQGWTGDRCIDSSSTR